jgi:para-nitrobenzyl esterase
VSSDVAATSAGVVKGVVEPSGVTVFRGVPFAAPPVGERRFAPPALVTPWEGQRPALEFGPASLQQVDPLSMVIPGAERNYYSPATATFSEDCLYLNVFTPAVDDKARPVMVWIHGGGFITGSGGAEWYDGTSLALHHDVVVVTINYRLGLLGSLYLGDLDPDATNFGMRDQVASLEWVRRNIAAFGGDPDNVTIFGQSAGGMAVGALLASPLAAGLFHRAIIQSGNVDTFMPVEYGPLVLQGVLAALKIGPGDIIADLRTVSTLRLLELQKSEELPKLPTLDGVTIASDPLRFVREGRGADVPLLIGNTSVENRLWQVLGAPLPAPSFDLAAALAGYLGDGGLGAEAASLYRHDSAASDPDLWYAATSDASWVAPSRSLADAHAAAGRPTYSYDFALASSVLGSAHSVEIPFVFDVLDHAGIDDLLGAEVVTEPAVHELAARVSAAWASFARTGTPELESIAEWPRYEESARATVVLDRVSSVVHERDRDRLDFWQAHPLPFPIVGFLSPVAAEQFIDNPATPTKGTA